ncbi:MAG TPA: DegT/DnrJ/EryC1/StrS family aminotransferase [Polyangia bacterium]|nr:DegT/DnrJ/EryC1/StrS family aminotransferase [Polyangia bacterium]
MSAVPPVDLRLQHAALADEIARGFAAVLDNAAFILGPAVKEFEGAYAAFIGARHCIGVANGTDALELALRATGAGAGTEVLLPVNTFIATALAVLRAGARPVLVDCDPEHHLLDVEQAAARATKRTRFLLPVHLYGQMAPIEQVEALARSHDLTVIEDAAQAQGARRKGRAAGACGLAAGTSFYPGKNLGAYGDAGAITTDSDEIAARLRALRNYGSEVKYHHPEIGFNSRLDTLQAVVLSAKLKRLAGWNEARRAAARRYDELLAGLPAVTPPRTLPGNEHVFHLYVVRVPNRDEVVKQLNADGIGAQIHYPVPIHLQGAFRQLGLGEGSFPVAERAAREILSLPIYPEITPDQQARVVESLRRALG